METSGPLFGRCENLPVLIPSHSLLHTHSSLAVPCGFDLSTTCCTPWCASDGRCGVSRLCVGCLLHVHPSVQELQKHGSKSRSTLSVSCLTHQVRSAPLRQLIRLCTDITHLASRLTSSVPYVCLLVLYTCCAPPGSGSTLFQLILNTHAKLWAVWEFHILPFHTVGEWRKWMQGTVYEEPLIGTRVDSSTCASGGV